MFEIDASSPSQGLIKSSYIFIKGLKVTTLPYSFRMLLNRKSQSTVLKRPNPDMSSNTLYCYGGQNYLLAQASPFRCSRER